MNADRMLQRAYERLGRGGVDWETALEGAYVELMATCQLEQVDILEVLALGAARGGVREAEINRVVNRLRDGEAVVPLADLLNPALMAR